MLPLQQPQGLSGIKAKVMYAGVLRSYEDNPLAVVITEHIVCSLSACIIKQTCLMSAYFRC